MGFDLIIYELTENGYERTETSKGYEFDGRPTGAREYVSLLDKICNDCIWEQREIYPECFDVGEYRYNISDKEYNKIKEELIGTPNEEYFIKITKLMKENKNIYFYDSF